MYVISEKRPSRALKMTAILMIAINASIPISLFAGDISISMSGYALPIAAANVSALTVHDSWCLM
jgi:hypothetical protein